MIRTEERSVRIKTSAGMAVDGVVRVRRFALRSGNAFRMGFSQHEPVAVIVRRGAREERVSIGGRRDYSKLIAFAALPLAARIAKRTFTHRSRRK